MPDVVVRLNLEDLRALFGGEDKPSVEFRNSIANKFASEYLKSMVTSQMAQERDVLIREEIKRVLQTTVLEGKVWADGTKNTLQAFYKDMVAITVDTEITNLIRKKVDEANGTIQAKSREATAEIQKLRDTTIIQTVDAMLSETRVKNLVEQLVAKHLDEFSQNIMRAIVEAAKHKD